MTQITVAQTVVVHPAQGPERQLTPRAKFWELFVLGVIIGGFSFALSGLWKGYEHKASDIIQYVTAELLPDLFVKNPDNWLRRHLLHFLALKRPRNPIVIIDIDEETCATWARDQYGGLCAALPRLPHKKLREVFEKLKESKPKLVVIDIDLRPERPAGPDSYPLDPDPNSFNDDENSIRDIVQEEMKDIPFLVAQPLIKEPKGDDDYRYAAAPTFLHNLDKTNLRFGHVEQDRRDIYTDDGVLRRFPATLQINTSSPFLDLKSLCPGLVEHLALKVCEPELGLRCKEPKGEPETKDYCGTGPVHPLRFGKMRVPPDGYVQFRYSFGRHLDLLANWNVRRVKPDDFATLGLKDAIVILGSTARGRGDYHFTPLNVFGGETAGVIVVANEIAAALDNKGLVELNPWWILFEKIMFVAISTIIVYFAFWRPRLRRPAQIASSVAQSIRSGACFLMVIAAVVLVNYSLGWLVSFQLFKSGQVADPVTPVVAAVLDGLVDLCSLMGKWIESRFD